MMHETTSTHQNNWSKLTRIGIDRRTAENETRQIVFLNAVVLLVLILVAQNIGLGLIYQVPASLLALFAAHGPAIVNARPAMRRPMSTRS